MPVDPAAISLPIDTLLPQLQSTLAHHRQIILSAPPGAGKSTRLPLYLLEQWQQQAGMIILLEPRRLAARNIASFIAEQLNEPLGQRVGLRMRGEERSSKYTRLLVVTEGVLTRMIQDDPELSGVALILFDEFHERSLHADLGLALALEVQEVFNSALRIMLMSATLDNTRLAAMLPDAPLLSCDGRCYPVETHYVIPDKQLRQEQTITRLLLRVLQQQTGSILVFLPGQREITRLAEQLEMALAQQGLLAQIDIAPLYGRLDVAAQRSAIFPALAGKRKVVLATNVAETSLTIEGVRIVIDSGLERSSRFDLASGITELLTQQISAASAEQRRGRAGRTEPGICYRLWPQSRSLAEHSAAPITTSDLTPLLLELTAWGESDPAQLSWLDLPPAAAIDFARQRLEKIGAIDAAGMITARGKKLHQLGVEPQLGQLILSAMEWQQQQPDSGALSLACDLAALLEEGIPRQAGRDLLAALPLVKQVKRLKRVADNWLRRMGAKRQVYSTDMAPILLAHAYPDAIAMNRGHEGRFLLSGGVGARCPIEDPLSSEPFLVAPLLNRNRSYSMQHHNGDVSLLAAIPISRSDLVEHCSQLITQRDWVEYDETKDRLIAETRSCLGQLILMRKPLSSVNDQQRMAALIAVIRRKGASWLLADESVQRVISRLHCAAKWFPQQAWFDVSESGLMAELELWLQPYLTGIKSLAGVKKCDLAAILLDRLAWNMRQFLDKQLPEHYLSPAGAKAPIRYQPGAAPVCSIRLQQLYGLSESPTVANGQRLLLELLSPAQRPIQLTSDLALFWQGSYQEVKKEMKGRYPKHFWPDDPVNAKPTLTTKNRM